MSIGRKLLLAVIGLVLFAFLTTLLFSAVIFRGSFLNLEKQNLESNIKRTDNALSGITGKLEIDTQDWAYWDDTYNFAQIGNTAYGNAGFIKDNFGALNFENKKINLIVVLDTNGKVVHAQAYDLTAHQEVAMPQQLFAYLSVDIVQQNTDISHGISGIVQLDDYPVLISAQPIFTSTFHGPSAGTLVFGVFMDSSFLEQLSQSTQTAISLWQENHVQAPADFQQAMNVLTTTGTDFTLPLNGQYAAGYTLVDDIFGKPAVVLKTEISRDVYNQGRLTIIFLFIALFLASILFGMLFLLIVRKTVLTRFGVLAADVAVIGRTGDFSKSIDLPNPIIKGRDELSELAGDINNMLGKLGETESKLLTQKTLFERLLLYTPAIILVVDGNVKITLVNKAFCTLFNVSEENAIGKHLNRFFPADEVLASGKKVSNVEGSVTIYEHRPKIGKVEKIIDTTIITVHHNEYLLIGRDITSEREEQEKLYLNDRLASVGEMAAGIAHELNNPLTGIVMLSQLLMQTDFPPDIKKDLSDINSEASRATDVVRNLLAFARKQPPAKRMTQINKTVNDVLRLRHYEETVNNIEVISSLDPDLPEIMVDNIQIQQVFLNLILNAEYSMINAHKKGVLEVDTSVANGKVVITFTDDGEGIKEENMRKMFQPFFTTKQVGVGTGLGLSLCYGIVTRHGGMIYVKSRYGSGATFIVELPIETSKTTGDESGPK